MSTLTSNSTAGLPVKSVGVPNSSPVKAIPPPMPCATRNAMRVGMSGARAAPALVITRIATPTRNMARAPHASIAGPAASTATEEASRNTETTQGRRPTLPRSAPIVGRTVITESASKATRPVAISTDNVIGASSRLKRDVDRTVPPGGGEDGDCSEFPRIGSTQPLALMSDINVRHRRERSSCPNVPTSHRF